jgi:hypothetical protein
MFCEDDELMNLKDEILLTLSRNGKLPTDIAYAEIWETYTSDEDEERYISLIPNYSYAEYEEFLKNVNFEYDNDYGKQYVQGYIVMNDGTWFERDDYDGREWWKFKKKPEFKAGNKR